MLGVINMDLGIEVFVLILAVYLLAAIRVANANERFAVYAIGRFVGLKGQGVLLKIPGGGTEWIRVALGSEGEVQSNELVLLERHAILRSDVNNGHQSPFMLQVSCHRIAVHRQREINIQALPVVAVGCRRFLCIL